MDVNNLGYDILHRVFSIIREDYGLSKGYKNYKKLVDLSSVCHTWRAIVLPILYERIYVHYDNDCTSSNAQSVLAGGFAGYTRVLDIRVIGRVIDQADVVAVLKEAGIDRSVWTRIKKLDFRNELNKSIDLEGNTGSALAAKEVVEFFGKHVPNMAEIECSQRVRGRFRFGPGSDYPCLLLTEFGKQYSSQLDRVAVDLLDPMAKNFTLPQQLTHLNVSMDKFECRLLTAVFAPSLQSLVMTRVSPDITWNWFDSGDQNDIWFKNLSSLAVRFNVRCLLQETYHNGDLSSVDMANFNSEYRDAVKKAQFPALAVLKVENYPYLDSSFYKLFDSCPLQVVDIESPKGAQQQIPLQMLGNLTRMNVKLGFDHAQFEAAEEGEEDEEGEEGEEGGGDGSVQGISEIDACKDSITALLSSPSSVRHAGLSAALPNTISLPSTLAWNLVQRLNLDFWVSLPSIYIVLEQMPKLQHLCIRFSAAYLGELDRQDAGEQSRVANKRVEYLAIGIGEDSEIPKSSLLYCLSKVLPLVPSLLKLDMDASLVGASEEMLSDPANLLDWVSQQMETPRTGASFGSRGFGYIHSLFTFRRAKVPPGEKEASRCCIQ